VRNFILSGRARQDLFEIWQYYAKQSVQAADKVRDELYASFEKLGETPGLGHYREELMDTRYSFGECTRISCYTGGIRNQ
jgi:antitoxin ParD1/3/4/toxin ParE1/3/4